MRRSISRWIMSLATAGVLALPVTSFAKAAQEPAPPQQQQPPSQAQPTQPQPDRPQPAQPPAQQTQPQQPPTQPQPTEPQPATATAPSTSDQALSPEEHLRQAQLAADGISATSIPAKDRADLAQLKRHLSNLERMGSSPSAKAAEPNAAPGESANATKPSWGTEVAAIDKIISDLAGSETSSPTSTPGATGTSGTRSASATIDDATRAKLMDVRSHLTAYAAGMAGTPSTPKTEATPTPSATAAPSEPSTTAPPSTTPQSPSSTPPPAATPSPENPPAGAQNPPSTQPEPNAATQQPPAASQQPAAEPAAAQAPVSTEEAHRHLVAARDALTAMTQLPAASQLSGEARTQVSQLITNFNELISNPPDWHASYQKVAASVTTLIGPDNSDAEAQGGAPAIATGATAAPGTVGTAGTATIELDPAIRAKLVEFRQSLKQFEKAVGSAK